MKLNSRIPGVGGSKSLFGVIAVLCLAFAPPVTVAEEDIDTEEVAEQEEEVAPAAPARTIEEVVVTGSRLKRDTFSSVSPLQIITGQVSRESGLLDAADILQESTAASGQQIDLTFQGFVLDNGPGSSTVNLRGLGPSRTLILINGRRVAPSGVEGAPTTPNLNLLPASIIQQYDLLLDGASSVYGSDAVAGVGNAILRKDYDGFEIEAYSSVPYHGAGQEHVLSLAWGKNWDRGFIGVAAEYVDSEAVEFADRPWTEDCTKHAEIDQNGRVRSKDLWYENNLGMRWDDDCSISGLGSRIFVPDTRYGSLYFTPGYSNGGWPSFSESSSPYGTFGIDGDGDGETDINFRDYTTNGRLNFSHMEPEETTYGLFAYGEYTFEGEMNLTPSFEFLYGFQDFFSQDGAYPIFPDVPGGNPFNVCNPEAEGGTDCGLAYDQLLTNPNYVRSFSRYYTELNGCFGLPPNVCSPAAFGLLGGPSGPITVVPVVYIEGDRVLTYAEQETTRFVAALAGDLPFINMGSVRDWTFDAALVYSLSESEAHRPGIRDDRLNLSLGVYSSTNTPCENDTGEELAADAAPGCVPVNLFAPSLYSSGVIGDFATPAERNYLFDSRDFDTEYEQTLVTLFASGDLFELPGGMVAAGVGVEWRKDEIRSMPDQVAAEGLFFGFFSDGGAQGSRVTKELFAEVELPLLGGVLLAEELTLNASARLTDDEYYGKAWTESFKLGYRPFNSLLLRATYGSSYRAPNLRELFLRGQSGFLSVFDPCLIPEQAWDAFTNSYVAAQDEREDYVLDNCRNNGVDPTTAYNGGFNFYSTEVSAGGALDLDEETSTSTTVGFSWEQPFTNAFELGLGANLYEIKIKDTIIEPSAQFIVNDCYFSETGVSPFCSRITREADSADGPPFFDLINQGFINRDLYEVEGVDINVFFADTFTFMERPFDVRVDINANRVLRDATEELDDQGNLDASEFQGEWYSPYWTFQVDAYVDYDRWRLRWGMNYIDGQKSDATFVDDWGDIYESTGNFSSTCLGPPNDVLCKDIDFVSDYAVHYTSLFWRGDWLIIGGGINNMFDKEPPFVNEGATLRSNVPLGAGYHLHGRIFFFSVQAELGNRF